MVVNILIEALLLCVYVEAKQRFVYFSLYIFGRFSAWFFFNGMVWNMLKLPLTLWLEGFLLKCVIVVLASRVQVTPMVFADVSILWCLHACLSTCWVSTQKCLKLSKFRSPSNNDVEHVEDRLVSVENMTPCHDVVECHKYSQTRSWFQTFLFVSLTKNLGKISNLDGSKWFNPCSSDFFVRGLVFLRVGSWKIRLWQTWSLFKDMKGQMNLMFW